MIRITDAVLLAAAVCGAVYTFQIKYEAEAAAKGMRSLKAQIVAQNRKIALLQADWALETSPAHLQILADRYAKQLKLTEMDSQQIIDVTELPALRIERTEPDAERYADKDGSVLTGGIGELLEREAQR